MTTAEILARKLCEQRREEIRTARKAAVDEENGGIDLSTLPPTTQRTIRSLQEARLRVKEIKVRLEQLQLSVDDDGDIRRTYKGRERNTRELQRPFDKQFDVLNKIETKVCVDLLGAKTADAKVRLERLRTELEKV